MAMVSCVRTGRWAEQGLIDCGCLERASAQNFMGSCQIHKLLVEPNFNGLFKVRQIETPCAAKSPSPPHTARGCRVVFRRAGNRHHARLKQSQLSSRLVQSLQRVPTQCELGSSVPKQFTYVDK